MLRSSSHSLTSNIDIADPLYALFYIHVHTIPAFSVLLLCLWSHPSSTLPGWCHGYSTTSSFSWNWVALLGAVSAAISHCHTYTLCIASTSIFLEPSCYATHQLDFSICMMPFLFSSEPLLCIPILVCCSPKVFKRCCLWVFSILFLTLMHCWKVQSSFYYNLYFNCLSPYF